MVTARQLVRRARSAYSNETLTDISTLKNALSWMNWLDSQKQRVNAAKVFSHLPGTELEQLPKGINSIPENQYCQGTNGITPKVLYSCHVVDANSAALLDQAARFGESPQQLIVKYLDRPGRPFLDRAIFWLSDFDDKPEKSLARLKPEQLITNLGLVGRVLGPKRRLLVLSFEVQQCYKPTLLDAGFAYYWAACPNERDCGHTRSLVDGRLAYREWVARPSELTLTSITVLESATCCTDEDQLPDTYWQGCREEVISHRSHLKKTP